MKKIAFTVIALLGLGTASFAQNSNNGVRPTTNRSQDLPRNRVLADNGVDSPFLRRFGFGVKVGLNVSEPECNRPSNMPRCWTSRLCTAQMATVSWNTI